MDKPACLTGNICIAYAVCTPPPTGQQNRADLFVSQVVSYIPDVLIELTTYREMVGAHCVRNPWTNGKQWLIGSDWLGVRVGSIRLVHSDPRPFCRVKVVSYVPSIYALHTSEREFLFLHFAFFFQEGPFFRSLLTCISVGFSSIRPLLLD